MHFRVESKELLFKVLWGIIIIQKVNRNMTLKAIKMAIPGALT